MRIATIKATGSRFIVDRLCFRTDTAHCYREITKVTYDRSNGKLVKFFYEPGAQKLSLEDVTISDVTLDKALAVELLEQSCKAKGTKMITGQEHRKLQRQSADRLLKKALGGDLMDTLNKIEEELK